MDKAARAAQIARCTAHTGDAFAFAPDDADPAQWFANSGPATAPGSAPLSPLIPPQALRLVGPRSAFAAPSREPREADTLTDAAGAFYRVHAVGEDRLNPLLTLYVTAAPV